MLAFETNIGELVLLLLLNKYSFRPALPIWMSLAEPRWELSIIAFSNVYVEFLGKRQNNIVIFLFYYRGIIKYLCRQNMWAQFLGYH
jgi:hypothetical protein